MGHSGQDPRVLFDGICRREMDCVYGFLKYKGVSSDAAGDLCAKVFLEAWKGFERFDRERPARPWLLGIARNVLRNEFGRAVHRREVLTEANENAEGSDDPEHTVHRTELRAVLRRCMDKLPRAQRQVVAYHYLMELPLVEIAAMEDVSSATVRSRHRLALERLERCVAAQRIKEA